MHQLQGSLKSGKSAFGNFVGNVSPRTLVFTPNTWYIWPHGPYSHFGSSTLAYTCKTTMFFLQSPFSEKNKQIYDNKNTFSGNVSGSAEMIPTSRGSILQPSRASQLPYNEKMVLLTWPLTAIDCGLIWPLTAIDCGMDGGPLSYQCSILSTDRESG